jgi:histidine triad (HIT) family protein
MENCLFCKIAAGQIPAPIVYQDQHVVAFQDKYPQAPHHILVIPRCHITSIADLTADDGPLLASIFTVTRKIAQDLKLDSGYRFVTNVGRDAGQSIFHLHFHLLSGRSFDWPPG